MKARIACLLALVVVAITPGSATQLQGEQRTEVIRNSARSCFANNVRKPENRPYALDVVDAFCTCVATSVVDDFSVEDLAAAGRQMTPDFERRRDALAAACSADTFGKAKKQ